MRYLRNRSSAAQPIIELKPTIVVSPPAKEERPPWQNASIAAGAVVPIAISAIALFFSVLAYQDQHEANAKQIKVNEIAVANSQRQDADQVAFWYTYSRPNMLIVQNLGGAPIYNTAVQLKIFVSFTTSARKPGKQYTIFWTPELGTVPPCSEFSIPLSDLDPPGPLVDQALRDNGQIPENANIGEPSTELSFPIKMNFTDANGLTWNRSSIGTLTRSAPLAKPLAAFDQSRYKPHADPGCA